MLSAGGRTDFSEDGIREKGRLWNRAGLSRSPRRKPEQEIGGILAGLQTRPDIAAETHDSHFLGTKLQDVSASNPRHVRRVAPAFKQEIPRAALAGKLFQKIVHYPRPHQTRFGPALQHLFDGVKRSVVNPFAEAYIHRPAAFHKLHRAHAEAGQQ